MKLVRFHATWCGPCKRFEPVINAFAEKHGIPIEHVDIEIDPDRAAAHNVLTVPTTVVLNDDGETVDVINGAVPTPVLTSRLSPYL